MNTSARKTVWIDLSGGCTLRCEGPALRIESANKASCWVPWQRLDMLILEGNGQVPTFLLAQAASWGVRVRFHGAHGAIYELDPVERVVDPLDAQWDALLEIPGWRRSWQAWRLRQTLWATARALGRPVLLADALHQLRPETLAQPLGLSPPRLSQALLHLHPMMKLDARGLLKDAGWSPTRLRRPRPGPDVASHVRRILGFEAVARWSRGIPVDPDRWYAAHREVFLARGRATVDGALRWLADITDRP